MNALHQLLPTVYELGRLSSVLNLPEGYFLTREQGERAYGILRQELETVPVGSALVLSFPTPQLIDVSFADESVIRLGEEIVGGAFDARAILLLGLTADSVKNLRAVIRLRELKLALLAVEPTGRWQVVGHLEPTLRETLDLVAERHQLTALELSTLRPMAINTASTRLKRLYDQHLVARRFEITKKGLEYIYEMWRWTSDVESPEE
ncbi:MAG: hypothetical protein M3R24_12855 [Chloroflexota bacterium]|nr:hypothetical protein [Chloroflexota bacterium]